METIEDIEAQVDDVINRRLVRQVTEDEVKTATFSLNPFSVLGDDGFTVKLDMSIAYDRVERNFVWKVMENMGFYEKWIDSMKECVTAVFDSSAIEGQTHASFKPCSDCAKATPSPSAYFLFAQKVYPICSINENRGEKSKD
ncbi:uncharacterized protein [Arachis hypogaea]|uniref:uncharacterized protein n=1 Tax=Arachis hypogaea TaxID=3818 RepID=UPI003B2213EE